MFISIPLICSSACNSFSRSVMRSTIRALCSKRDALTCDIHRVVTRDMGSGIKGLKRAGIKDHSPGIRDHKAWDRDQQCFSSNQESG